MGGEGGGPTADPWWGPPVEDVIRDLAARGHTAVVVCSAGFVTDHLEVLYDLDIEARQVAEEAGVAFAPTHMPNDHPALVLRPAEAVREHPRRGAPRWRSAGEARRGGGAGPRAGGCPPP